MQLTEFEARSVGGRALARLGYDAEEQDTIFDHLIDSASRGQPWGGLPRVLVFADRIGVGGHRRQEPTITRDTPISCSMDARGTIGYLAGPHAARLAIAKALESGIGIVGVANTFYTGNLSYYAEMAARQGLISLVAGNGDPSLAPYGSREAILGTNPIAFGFPSVGDPVVWDASASSITHSELKTRVRMGSQLEKGAAVDRKGRYTTDPTAVLEGGAVLPWGGHRGSGLAIAVQLLGALAGSEAVVPAGGGFALFIQAMRPDLLSDPDEFGVKVAQLGDAVRSSQPSVDGPPRMPYDGSLARRRSRRGAWIEVSDSIYRELIALGGHEADRAD
jgi:LDH2 family malate/lactate/ureidoglycolate dehydrogenase